MNEINTESAAIKLKYDLYNLPTAQHKAGLAGLILMLESMKMRKLANIPEYDFTETEARITLTRESIQTLFDDLYNAEYFENIVATKRSNKSPKREEVRETKDESGKIHKNKYYVYDDCRPGFNFLKTLLPTDGELWLKLWRDMTWGTLRGIPTTRKVYEERANNSPSSVANDFWSKLGKSQNLQKKNRVMTDGIVSSLFIGAQDVNAENVPFLDTVENIFLLHFWILVSLIYIPRRIKKDSKSNSFILEEIGYVLTVPEPVNLEYFVEDARRLLGTLETDKSGFRPRSALISLPEESGLEYYFGLAMSKIETREISYSLASVEIYHLEKQGNNIKILAANHLSPDLKILTGYNSIREQCRNLLWRSIRITNLLTGKLWFANIDTLFNRYPYEFFIYKRDKTPSRFPFFGHDVGKKFNAIMDNLKGGDLMSEVTPDDRLALCIYRLIREYANRKTEEKSGIKYDGFKNNKDKDGHTIYPPKYLETKEDICSGAFLAMRSRNGQDFIEFFISTMGSVPQFLPEKDYLLVSQMLISQPEIVKNLSMLALSAHSR